VVDLLTALVVQTTLLPPTMVRPRWQPTPPEQPPAGASWAAVGIPQRTGQGYTHQAMSTLPGTTTEALLLRRWVSFQVLFSFYGPDAEDVAELFRDSIFLVQNLAGLYAYGIKVTWAEEVLAVPDLTNLQWIDHQDIRVDFVREYDRYYPMQHVIEANGTIVTDVGYHTTLDSNEAIPKPPPIT
jgi:hypothetical protein